MVKYFSIILLSLSLTFLFLFSAYAQSFQTDSTNTDSLSAFSVTADPAIIYASQTRNPFTTSAITHDEIEQLKEPIIEPLLNSVPGVWMQTGALNTNRISIRGVGYREPFATTGIKIYLDEIPLTNGVGESSIEDIHPFLFSGIDVWRGPSSALWGSGLGGMIHLKTDLQETNSWSSGLQVGSYDRIQFDQHLNIRYGPDDRKGTALHYQYLTDDGYRQNNMYKKHSMTWMQHWSSKENIRVNTFVHGIDLKAFIPSSINEFDFNNNPSAAAPTWNVVKGNEDYTKWITGLNVNFFLSPKWNYRGALFATFFNSDEVRPFNVLEESNISYGMRHRVSFKAWSRSHFNFGVEYFKEDYAFNTFQTLDGGIVGMQLTDEKEDRTYFNGFAQAEIDLHEKWICFAGLHLTANQLSGDSLKSDLPLYVYPTAGVNYSMKPSLSFSASLSRGYTNLGFDDILNSQGVIVPGIKPETGWSKELSVLWGSYQTSYIKAGYYHMNVDNTLITVRIADDIFEKVNSGSAIHQGIELEYNVDALKNKISLSGSYTYSDHRSIDVIEGEFLPGTPKHRTFHNLGFHFLKAFEFAINHHYISKVFLNDANTVTNDGYQLLNAAANFRFALGEKWNFKLGAHIHNLFDTHYASMFQINAPSSGGGPPRYYYPGKPRSFYLNLNATYSF